MDKIIQSVFEEATGEWKFLISFPGNRFSKIIDPFYLLGDGDDSTDHLVDQIRTFWLDLVQSLKNGEAAFLPIEIEDEYIGGIRLIKEDDQSFQICFGYIFEGVETSVIEFRMGHAPSNLELKNFKPEFEERISREKLINGLL